MEEKRKSAASFTDRHAVPMYLHTQRFSDARLTAAMRLCTHSRLLHSSTCSMLSCIHTSNDSSLPQPFRISARMRCRSAVRSHRATRQLNLAIILLSALLSVGMRNQLIGFHHAGQSRPMTSSLPSRLLR